jgi:hypothetical protein
MEYWRSKADDGLFLFYAWYHSYKNRSNSTKPNTPTLHFSNTPWHSFTAKPIFSDLAQKTRFLMLDNPGTDPIG